MHNIRQEERAIGENQNQEVDGQLGISHIIGRNNSLMERETVREEDDES